MRSPAIAWRSLGIPPAGAPPRPLFPTWLYLLHPWSRRRDGSGVGSVAAGAPLPQSRRGPRCHGHPRAAVLAALALAACLCGVQAADDPLGVPVTRETPAGPVTLVPIPTPDLSRAEEVVRRNLGEARSNLGATLAQSLVPPGVPDSDLAASYGQTGGYYLAHKLWVAAEACYTNAERLDPKDPRWPYYLGYRYEQDAQPELAAGAYARALGLNPEFTVARLRLGLVYLSLDRLDEAVPLLTAAAEDPGLRGAALYGLGRTAQARRDPTAAVPLFEQALTQDPDATQIHYSLAMAYRALGKVDEARAHLALRGDGEPRITDPLVDDLAQLLSGARTLYYRGIEALRDGHFDVAVAAFTEALGLEPENVNARVTLARALYLAGNPSGAATQLTEALEHDPNHALALYLRGALLDEQGDEEGTLNHYRRALASEPDHGGAHHALGNALMRRGDYQGALGHYAAAQAAVPQNAPAALMRAMALVRQGPERQGEAREVLESALRDHPEDAALGLTLARLLAASPAAAVRDGPRALALAQGLFDRANTLENAETLAMAQAETGEFADAAALQKNALIATAAAGRFGDLPRLQANLTLYQAGAPCRAPWLDQDPIFYPPPLPARGPMQEYPTRAAY
jgi:tetratricopeptide (TPR) repeat protein